MIDGLDLLSRVCRACELVGLDVQEALAELGETAAQGLPMSLMFELAHVPQAARQLSITAEPAVGEIQAAVRLLQAHRHPVWVYAALQIQHEWPHNGMRFSMDMANGDLVLSGVLPVQDLDPQDLAALLGDVILGMNRLLALGDAASVPSDPQGSGVAPDLMVRG
jgi:hypothetical protein